MEARNNVIYFVLLRLTQNPKEQKVLSVMFLLCYILTVVDNLLIVVTITVSKTLNSPMYFFLASFSFMDVNYSSSITPRLISDLFSGEKYITFKSCMTQLFTEHLFFFLDQESSFCWWWPMPLCYFMIMRQRVCVVLLDGILGWRFSALSNLILHCLWALILWPQCHWSLSLWHVPFTETVLCWYLCHWYLSCGQWGTDLHYCVSAFTHLLWSRPALSEEPESGREVESPPDLWFPHHCGCLLLCSLYFHVCKTCWDLLHW